MEQGLGIVIFHAHDHIGLPGLSRDDLQSAENSFHVQEKSTRSSARDCCHVANPRLRPRLAAGKWQTKTPDEGSLVRFSDHRFQLRKRS